MEAVRDVFLSLRRYVSNMELGDILEILIIAYLVYHIMLWIKTTRAWALLKGLIVIAVFGASPVVVVVASAIAGLLLGKFGKKEAAEK